MTRFHIQVPECSYDYVVLPSMAWCATISTGWLVAGEWICSNILLKKGAMGAWDDSKDLLATAIGGLGWMTTLGYTSVDLKKSQTNRCLLGTGFLIFGTSILAKQWKTISVIAKVACFGHIASGLFMCCTKPKVGKTGGDAAVAAKK